MANDAGQGSKANGRKSGMNIDTAMVRELAELLNETGLTEIEVEDDVTAVLQYDNGTSATFVTSTG